MVEYHVSRFKVKSLKTFHLQNIYIDLHDYLIEEDYVPSEKDWDYQETFMWENRTQKDGREIWIWFRPWRKLTNNPFFKRRFRINFHARRIKDVEIMHEGKKLNVNKGEVEIFVFGYLDLDPEGKWMKNAFTRTMWDVFVKRMYHKSLEAHRREMLADSYKLQEHLKNLLGQQMFSPPRKTFRPTYAFGERTF